MDGSNVRDRRTDAERFAIAREIAEALKGSFGEIRSAFRAYDVNSDGHCSSTEFGELLMVGGGDEHEGEGEGKGGERREGRGG